MSAHLTYLLFELLWALPVLGLQWVVGQRALWRERRTLFLALTIGTLYLSLTDSVAIANGIWTLHRDRIVGLQIGNLPVEEAIFFLLTNAMVVQSIVLVRDRWKRMI